MSNLSRKKNLKKLLRLKTVQEIETVAEPVEQERKAEQSEAPKTTTRVLRPTGTQYQTINFETKDALKAGFKPGERVVSEAQTKSGKLSTDKDKDKKEKPKKIARDAKGGRPARIARNAG